MHKRLAVAALLILLSNISFAQDVAGSNTNSTPAIVKPSRDFLMLQFNYTNWTTKDSTVKTKGFNYGFNGFICYDFPIKKTHFSFAAGIGISTSSIYMADKAIRVADTGALAVAARFVDTSGFKRIKFTTAYLQAPFELRFFGNNQNRNRGFKAAIGVQVGTLLGAHTKYVESVEGVTVKLKTDTKRYVSPWNFAATARIGWGNFSLFGSYNITNVFRDGQGPTITPYSIGICLTGL